MDKLYFILTFGYPKIPGTSIPIGLIIIFIDFIRVRKLFEKRIILNYYFISTLFITFGILSLIISNNGWQKEYSNIASLSYKLIISPYIAYLAYNLILKSPNFIFIYVLFQSALISLSSFYKPIFDFLLLFQSNEAASVFDEIFGVRSVGFGVFHNEGVIGIFYLYAIYTEYNKIKYSLNDIFVYSTALMSRIVIFPIAAFQIFRSGLKSLVAISIIIFIIPYIFDINQGPLSEMYEGYINYQNGEGFTFRNTNHILSMVVYPDDWQTWAFGNHKFFESDGTFHQGTDIGFLRLIFFGGLPITALYVLLHIYPIVSSWKKLPKILAIMTPAVFIFANLKGLAPHLWSPLVLYFLYKENETLPSDGGLKD